MSWKSIFMKEDDVPGVVKKPNYTAPPTQVPVVPQGLVSQATQVDPGSADEFNQFFRDVMDKANLPGPDYYEFAKALDTMKSSGLTEQQKFLAVFAGFAAQGVTSEKLVEAANKYITILEDWKVKQFDSSVNSAVQQIKNTQDEHDRLVKENEDLSKKMQENNTKISSLQTSVIELQGKLESKKTTFTMSFNNFISKIKEDVEHIKNYLFNGNTAK